MRHIGVTFEFTMMNLDISDRLVDRHWSEFEAIMFIWGSTSSVLTAYCRACSACRDK